MTKVLSPYQLNPMNLNPLRDVLHSVVDCETLHKQSKSKLFICASNVLTGKTNPAGRLPLTFYRSVADLPPFDRDATEFRYDRWHGWWHLARNATAAACRWPC